jgi:hypothetical protein
VDRATAKVKDTNQLGVGVLFRLFQRFLCALFQFFRAWLGDGLCD